MSPKLTKSAVVTGAGRGIGRALVEELSARNYRIGAVVRDPSHVDELTALPGVSVLVADIMVPETESRLSSFLDESFDKVDLLINNAGFGARNYGIDGLDYQELQRLLDIHCFGAIRCVKGCLPHLRRSEQATIINMSSRFGSLEWVARGVVPHQQATYPYRIAKAAMNMFTSCLAIELQEEGIRVVSMDPGKVKTRFGPVDADVEPSEAARSILSVSENLSDTGLFIHASGDKVPW